MKRRVTDTILSILISIFGFYLLYSNISDPAHISSISVIISLILLVMGIIMLFRSGRHDHSKIHFGEPTMTNNGDSLLSRHKDIINNFQKHSKMRDKLKAIKHIEIH